MFNASALEIPPPGEGLNTVTLAVPATAMSFAEIEAVSLPELTKLVSRSEPFQRTIEVTEFEPDIALTKFEPRTVRTNPESPAATVVGFRLESDGTGFGGLLTVKVRALDVPPPGAGLKTVTLAVPAVAMSLAGMLALT
jgi:hypothetical protein